MIDFEGFDPPPENDFSGLFSPDEITVIHPDFEFIEYLLEYEQAVKARAVVRRFLAKR